MVVVLLFRPQFETRTIPVSSAGFYREESHRAKYHVLVCYTVIDIPFSIVIYRAINGRTFC